MRSRIFPVILTAAATTVATLFFAARFQEHTPFFGVVNEPKQSTNHFANFDNNTRVGSAGAVDLQTAAEASVNAVVHIKTSTKARTVVAQEDDFFGNLFGQRQYYIPPQMGSGSGVVISSDGYIVTNNHVVAGAENVTVTFNNRFTTEAKVIGTDPAFDIAILKVNEKNLPYLEFGNSDDVKLGQWVLAAGYPLTLDATVTAGIVSAKGRSIGINKTQSANAIESFIQTDAAVNPGNSGGALVNTSGLLIGINSAIASPTGSYAGYSYAIPSNIVRKVANDLMQYGSVQRAYLGIIYLDRDHASPEQLAKLGIDRNDGVYVDGVTEGGGASKAGLKKGDFITKINGASTHTENDLVGQVANYKPGDNVSITYVRNGKTEMATVELRNVSGNTSIIKESATTGKFLGASFRIINADEKRTYNVRNGLVVTDLGSGVLAKQTNMKKGFIIVSVNDKAIGSVDDLHTALASGNNAQIAGFYPGYKGMYYYGLNDISEGDKEQ